MVWLMSFGFAIITGLIPYYGALVKIHFLFWLPGRPMSDFTIIHALGAG